ncbi:hypothetical protein HGRIS_008698 [Hohenbuehelia grisea]|uniref:F-box domain-containing protein n=1 Tax=Hohenbuehelia grisea TaxID=104357 RepID=A0ABR3JA93_9AGAR
MSLEDAPADIIMEISSHLSNADAANFRMSCRIVEACMTPQFFQKLEWDISRLASASQVESFLVHVARARSYVTTLCLKKVDRRLLFRSNAAIQKFAEIMFNGTHAQPRTTRIRRASKIFQRIFCCGCSCFPSRAAATQVVVGDSLETIHDASILPAKVLGEALSSLKVLRTFRWSIDTSPAGMEALVINSLAPLASLKSFSIDFKLDVVAFSMPLHRLTNLEIINIHGSAATLSESIFPSLPWVLSRSPLLSSLHIDVTQQQDDSIVECSPVFSRAPEPLPLRELCLRGPCNISFNVELINHFHSLSSLSLCPHLNCGNLTSHKKLFRALQDERVYLRQLTTEIMHEQLVDYLSSYSGLRILCLRKILICIKVTEALSMESMTALPIASSLWLCPAIVHT